MTKASRTARTSRTSSQLALATRAYLLLSYQRYALASAAVAAAIVALGLMIGGTMAIAASVVVALLLCKFSISIALRFNDKMRATRIAMIRISQQRFRPDMIRHYCSDPCFRVVADECLRRAGLDRKKRRKTIVQYRTELRDEPATLLVRDPATGRTILVGGHHHQA